MSLELCEFLAWAKVDIWMKRRDEEEGLG